MPELIGTCEVEVVTMVEDDISYCDTLCHKKTCNDCKHKNQKCGFSIPFILQRENPSKLQMSCGNKPEDYEITLRTQEQRYDSIIMWLNDRGYYFSPTAHNAVMKPNGAPATFDCLMEEIYQWLLHNRGHTGIDDYIIAIASYRHGASLRFLGSFIGSKRNGLVARIYEHKALRKDIPTKVKVSEAKKLGYSKSDLLKMGYKEKQFRGIRYMVLPASNL